MEAPLLDHVCIFAWNLASHLPGAAQAQFLLYDGRLEQVFPGIQVYFAQRALLHFVREVEPLSPGAGPAEHAALVDRRLAATEPSDPETPGL